MNASEPMMTGKNFVISRVFDTPRENMWKVWTQPEHMKSWFGPKGFTGKVAKMDLRPGGTYHYCIEAPEGASMWGKFSFLKVEGPSRLEYINSFSDEQGGTTRHPMHTEWPLEMMTVITFEEEEGKTKVTVDWSAHNANATEQETFDDNHNSMRIGWGGTFDRLAEYLQQL